MGNFSINVVDQSKFKFDLATISTKGFKSNLTINNTVGDLKKAVQQYVEGKLAPAVKKKMKLNIKLKKKLMIQKNY
ncbi:hypothetical protein [Spiroplasma endosymbiont of Ammophila pubescens]|uniref:hypothetical protein n=1 Tax=Spiroplasma endosymbiont of Ammophila pubescens TaxID=3066315 RepID=UPI0032B20CE5